jgi:ornithine cyclodeaminase
MRSKSARLASHSPLGVIELMPVSDGVQFAFKYVNGHPRNAQHALPTVMACGMLAEVETGFPLLLADLTLATALRTAATSVLAARGHGAARRADHGVDRQWRAGRIPVAGLPRRLGVDTVRAFDIDAHATARLMRNLAAVPGLSSCRHVRCETPTVPISSPQ